MNLGEFIVGSNVMYELEVILDEGCDDHYPDFAAKTFATYGGERYIRPEDITDICDYQAFEVLLMPITTTMAMDNRVVVYVNPWRREGPNVLARDHEQLHV